MNKDYTFYNQTTGIISYSINCSEEVFNNILAETTDSYLEGDFPKEFFYIENAKAIAIPEKPSIDYIFNYGTKVWELDLQIAETRVKNIRNQLLQNSDWTDTVSAQTRLSNWQEWQDYRQALRDITSQEGYPLNVVFPTQPTL